MEHAQAVATVRPKWLALGAVAVLLGLVLRAAWVTDDSYVTLRAIDNWVNGLGLGWNVGERVQGFTHPLWMLVLSVFYFLTREGYFTAVAAGVLTTLGAVLLLIRNARSEGHAIAAVILLMLTRSFVEFSTSGLENPLTHLLIAQFIWLYALHPASLRVVTLSAALLALNRSDAVIVALPALAHLTWQSVRGRGWKPTVVDLLIGGSPVLAWVAFSLFYFGFPVPNTAFAKLNTGLPRNEVVRQGLTYVLNALAWDPPILIVTALGLAVAVIERRPRQQALALGVALYFLYVIQIGGDFMLGRFLTLPLFVSASLIASSSLPLEDPTRVALVLVPLVLIFLHPAATERYPVGDFHHSGVADERMYYRESTGLMYYTRTHGLPSHAWGSQGRDVRARKERVVVHENIGFFGFFAGPDVHIIDRNALTEPLLARLPARYDPNWRVGHFLRDLPPGYLETVKAGTCQMPDASLCEYYAKLKEIISGDLWSWSRFKTIAAMNFGSYEYLIDKDRYRYPGLVRAPVAELTAVVGENAPWDSPGTRIIQADGIELDLGRVSHARNIAISLDGNDDYDIELRSGTESLVTLTTSSLGVGNMHTRHVAVPDEVSSEGFDRIWVRPSVGDGHYSVGYVRLTH